MGYINDRKILMAVKTVNVGGGGKLNIKCSSSAPDDTSLLWIKENITPNKTIVDSEVKYPINYVQTLTTSTYGATVNVGNYIYIFGGYNGSSIYDTIYKYNTVNDTVTTLTTKLPYKARDIFSCVTAVGTDIYICGGYDNYGYKKKTILIFDTTSDTITTSSTELAKYTSNMSVSTVGTDIYLFGGATATTQSGSTTAQYIIQKLDTLTGTLSTMTSTLANYSAYSSSAITVGTDIYLFGGNVSSSYSNSIQKYNTLDDTISTVLSLSARTYIGATLVGTDIYLFGGNNNSSRFNIIQIFDTTSDTITTSSTTLNLPTTAIGTSAVGNKIYLIGGFSYENGVSTYRKIFSCFNTADNSLAEMEIFPLIPNNNLVLKTNDGGIKIKIISGEDFDVFNYFVDALLGNGTDSRRLKIAYYDSNSNEWVEIN